MSGTQVNAVAFEWQPDVWVLVFALGAGYVWALRRLGPRVAPDETMERRRLVLFFAGLAVLAVATTWPLDTIGDEYLFSIHMVQYLLMTLVAAPLLLAGLPGWLLRELTVPVRPLLSVLARPVPALLILDGVLVLSHWPALVDLYVRVDAVHFGMHVLWVCTGLLFWLPVLSPIPEYPKLSEPMQMVYLFASSIIPTVPASFLTFAHVPLFSVYAQAPRLWGITALEDTRAAGLTMKIGGAVILWSVITVLFFRWASREMGDSDRRVVEDPVRCAETATPPPRTWSQAASGRSNGCRA